MKKALIVGINDYPGSPLHCCINDASTIASILETHGDGSPNFAVQLITDIDRKSHLKSKIEKLFKGNDDMVLLYFAGHGFLNSIGGYIVTPDYEHYDEGINMDEILNIAFDSKAKDKIIILDCCHSGALGSPRIDAGATRLRDGITILTATRDSEAALEINGHGIFTNLLIEALNGGAADLRGHITPGGVYAYIDQALGPWDQRPVFKTCVERFTSLRTISPRVPLEVLRLIVKYFPKPQEEYKLDPTYEFTNEDIANPENVAVFKNLQKFYSVGLVIPVGEEHMYWAAQRSTSCKLTPLGYHYWRLVKDKRI